MVASESIQFLIILNDEININLLSETNNDKVQNMFLDIQATQSNQPVTLYVTLCLDKPQTQSKEISVGVHSNTLWWSTDQDKSKQPYSVTL